MCKRMAQCIYLQVDLCNGDRRLLSIKAIQKTLTSMLRSITKAIVNHSICGTVSLRDISVVYVWEMADTVPSPEVRSSFQAQPHS